MPQKPKRMATTNNQLPLPLSGFSEEQMSAISAEEARKTISHLAEQERLTAQHKAEVENSLQGLAVEGKAANCKKLVGKESV